MKLRWIPPLVAVACVLAGCRPRETKPRYTARNLEVAFGGQPAVSLERDAPSAESGPALVRAVLLPGRGFNTYQLQAYLPGRGMVNLFTAPALEDAARIMDGGPEDFYGNKSFTIGGAILIPYANRIRGKFWEKERAIETQVAGRTVKLPANWRGKKPGAEWHAMHGLILDQALANVATSTGPDHATVTGVLDAGNFRGHWLSKTWLDFSATLSEGAFEFSVTARNTGNEPLPIGVGWHPYFELPSGKRSQARLRVPAKRMAIVNNYDDVFPTGAVEEVKGTPYDFSMAGGAPLKDLFLDDCFVDLEKNARGENVSEILDPEANYGIRIIATSPAVSAVQVYAPVESSFIALEPQFNRGTPFSPIWKGADTGMVTLKPGETVKYHVRLELFVP